MSSVAETGKGIVNPSPTDVDLVIMDSVLLQPDIVRTAQILLRHNFDAIHIAHGALVLVHKKYPGHDSEAIAQTNAFLGGVDFVLKAIEQAASAQKSDRELFGDDQYSSNHASGDQSV